MLCSSSLFLLVPKEGFASGLWHFLAICYMWCPACLFDFVCLGFVVVLFVCCWFCCCFCFLVVISFQGNIFEISMELFFNMQPS